MKRLIRIIRIIIVLIVVFIILHITPTLALRTHIFIMGYPNIAVTSSVESDLVHKDLETGSEKFYTVTPAPIEEVTGGSLTSYKVRRFGFIYIASYYGEA